MHYYIPIMTSIENSTIAQLREFAKAKNLPIKGLTVMKKSDIVKAIQDALAGKEVAKPDYANQKKYSKTNYERAEIARLRTRIQDGQAPRKSTLDKYAITIDQVNLWRAEKGLEPIAMPTPLLSIPRAKAIKAIENQNRAEMEAANQLAESAKSMFEAKELAVAAAKKINNEKLETIVNLQFGKLSLDDIANFFRLKTTYNPEGRTINTVESYVKRMRHLFEKVLECPNNVLECLNNKEIVEKIKAKYPNPNTRNSYIKVLSILFREFPGIQNHISKEVVEAVQLEFVDSKNKAEARNVSKVNNEIEPFPVIKQKLLDAFPKNSKEHLIAEMYDQFNARDDFGDVILISDLDGVKSADQNYMVYANPVVLVLQVYKTDKRYGKIVLPATDSKIYDILKAQGKKVGDLLISKDNGKMYNDKGALSSIISRMLQKAGVDRFGDKQAINLLRAAKKTELLSQPGLSAEDYELIARNAMHSPLMQLKYMRKIRAELMAAPKDEDAEKPVAEPVAEPAAEPVEESTKKTTKKSKTPTASWKDRKDTPQLKRLNEKRQKKQSQQQNKTAETEETPPEPIPEPEEPKQTRYSLRGRSKDAKKEIGGDYNSEGEDILNLQPLDGIIEIPNVIALNKNSNHIMMVSEKGAGKSRIKPMLSPVLVDNSELSNQVRSLLQHQLFTPQDYNTIQNGKSFLSKTITKLKEKSQASTGVS